jgi:hypothetical protein
VHHGGGQGQNEWCLVWAGLGRSHVCKVEGPWMMLGGGTGTISMCSTLEFLTLYLHSY